VEPGSGRFTYTYDDAGRIETIVNPQLDRTTYVYDEADRRTGIFRQSGNRTTFIYDNASQITNILHRNSAGTVITAFTYTYDNAGMRTLVHEVGASVTWGYNTAYRLINEERKSGGATVYRDTLTYDDVGNRTVYQKGSSLPTTYTYDAANQLETAVNGAARTTYTYDLNGNVEVENASGTLTTHTWNDENQLTQVAKTGMTTNQYTFNGDGQRVQVVDSQGTKKPIWDIQNILLETDGSNVTQVVYTLEPAGYGNLISQRRSSTTSYYLFDALGSTRKLTGSASSITDSYDFRAYGETFASSGSTVNVFRWIGERGYYLDIDRLAYYLRARPYIPAIARFLSCDPSGYEGSQWNLYEYVSGKVIVATDPSGREKFYVCSRPTEAGPLVGKCSHTQIWGDESGLIYDGWYGPVRPFPGRRGLPTGPNWKCVELKPSWYWYEGSFFFRKRHDKTLRWGPAGKPCSSATSADIIACLRGKPGCSGDPPLFPPIPNCQTDVSDAMSGCCLTGYQPLPPVLDLPPVWLPQ
jgi:RHS repeat-associated protein